MAWSSLLPNQMVTEGDMAQIGMALKPGQNHGSGNKCMTKLELLNKYNLDVVELASYSNSQLVQRQDIVSGVVGYGFLVSFNSYADSANACAWSAGSNSFTIYAATQTYSIGTVFYEDVGLTIPFNGGYQWWYFINDSKALLIERTRSGGQVADIFDCSLPTRYR